MCVKDLGAAAVLTVESLGRDGEPKQRNHGLWDESVGDVAGAGVGVRVNVQFVWVKAGPAVALRVDR